MDKSKEHKIQSVVWLLETWALGHLWRKHLSWAPAPERVSHIDSTSILARPWLYHIIEYSQTPPAQNMDCLLSSRCLFNLSTLYLVFDKWWIVTLIKYLFNMIIWMELKIIQMNWNQTWANQGPNSISRYLISKSSRSLIMITLNHVHLNHDF